MLLNKKSLIAVFKKKIQRLKINQSLFWNPCHKQPQYYLKCFGIKAMVYCTLYPDEMFKNPKITKFCNNNVLSFSLPKVVIARRCCMQFTHGEKFHSTRQGGGPPPSDSFPRKRNPGQKCCRKKP